MPLPTPGLIWHSAATSITASHNDLVGSWANEQGGSPATASGGVRPAYDTSSGVPALRFDGAQYLTMPDNGALDGVTLAMRIRAISGTYVLGDLFNFAASTFGLFSENNGSTNNFGIYTGAVDRTAGGIDCSDWITLVISKPAGIGADLEPYLNDTPLAHDDATIAAPTDTDGALIGAYAPGSAGTFLCRDVVIYDGESDATKVAAIVAAIEEGTGGGGPSITAVTPSTFRPGDTVTVTGSGFGATQGSTTFDIDGVAQTASTWSDTSISFVAVLGPVKYGAKTLTINPGSPLTASVTVNPPSGWAYVNVGTLNPDPDLRLTFTGATPEQVEYQSPGTTVFDDLTFVAEPGISYFMARGWATGEGWGPLGAQKVGTDGRAGRFDPELILKAWF